MSTICCLDDQHGGLAMFMGRFALAFLAAMILAPAASAQNFPTRPMTIVVPFGVGSALDLIARIIGSRLAEVLGQPVLVENVSGGGGMTAAARVANAPPDGYQMLHGGVDVMSMNQTLYKKPLYNAQTDFVPVGLVGDQALVLLARNDFPANDMQEFIAYTKANHAKMQFGSGGAGSGAHLNCMRVNAAIGVEVTHVSYRGSAQALQDLFAGRIDYYCALGAAAAGPIENKQRQGDRDPDARSLAAVPDAAKRPRTRPHQFPCRFLDRPVPAQGHARAHRPEAEPGLAGDAEHAFGAGAAAENRRDRGRARSPLAGLPEVVRRERDQIVGGHHQGERRRAAVMREALAVARPAPARKVMRLLALRELQRLATAGGIASRRACASCAAAGNRPTGIR